MLKLGQVHSWARERNKRLQNSGYCSGMASAYLEKSLMSRSRGSKLHNETMFDCVRRKHIRWKGMSLDAHFLHTWMARREGMCTREFPCFIVHLSILLR
jgi:hypothetical protein